MWDYRLIAPKTPKLKIFNEIEVLKEFTAKDLIKKGYASGTVYRVIYELKNKNLIEVMNSFHPKRRGGPKTRVYKVVNI